MANLPHLNPSNSRGLATSNPKGRHMNKAQKSTIKVLGADVAVLSQSQQDTICLTDIAKFKNPDHPDDVIRNWLRSRNTVEFLGIWERLNNPNFNPVEFDGIRMQTGLNSFFLSAKKRGDLRS